MPLGLCASTDLNRPGAHPLTDTDSSTATVSVHCPRSMLCHGISDRTCSVIAITAWSRTSTRWRAGPSQRITYVLLRTEIHQVLRSRSANTRPAPAVRGSRSPSAGQMQSRCSQTNWRPGVTQSPSGETRTEATTFLRSWSRAAADLRRSTTASRSYRSILRPESPRQVTAIAC